MLSELPVTVETSQAVVHTSGLGGDQRDGLVASFADGSFAVAKRDHAGTNAAVRYQLFNADGSARGTVVSASQFGTLRDMVVTSDGNLVLATTNGSDVLISILDPDTGAVIGFNNTSFAQGFAGVQLLARAGGVTDVVLSLATNVAQAFSINATGGTIGIPASLGTQGGSVVELVAATTPGNIFALMSDGSIVSSNGASSAFGPPFPTDMVKMVDGFYVLSSVQSGNNQIRLTGMFGTGDSISAYAIGATVTGSAVPGATGGSALTTAQELVHLGEGRVLALFGSFNGAPTVGSPAQSGVYAQVFNLFAGNTEGAPVLLQPVFALNDLLSVKLQGVVLADGRVAVAMTRLNGLTGLDVFRTILDPRIEGIAVAATAAADHFIGTSFADTFTGVGDGDTIVGGAGADTVILAGATPRQIDLSNPAAFGPASVALSQIEHLVSGNGADILLGNAAANLLEGGAGDDFLAGRDGNHSLTGGIANDTLEGGAGDDVLDGGGNNDLALGGLGADLVFGGNGNDTLAGNAGADTLEGGEGADLLIGGLDDDLIHGGGGNDTIDATLGTDTVLAGLGDDLVYIVGDSGVFVDGGGGTDTASYARSAVSPLGIGVYADLAGLADPLAAGFGFAPDAATLTRVEHLHGTLGADFLAGDDAGNSLRGGSGADVLLGRAGADTLVGGAGADIFLFENSAGGNDRIRDFTPGEDRIGLVLDGFGDIDASTIASRFVANATAAPAGNGTAQILFDTTGLGAGRLLFDADGNGAGAAVAFATLQFTTAGGLTGFGAADFVFI